MSQKSVAKEKGPSDVAGKVVLVAAKASKEIPRAALVWALTHIVQPGDTVKLLVVLPAFSSGIRGFARFTSDCTASHRKSFTGTLLDQKEFIADSCSQLVLQLHELYDPEKVKIRIKIISGPSCGVVAAEARRVRSSWVILDKKLKEEKRYCMEELNCNVVVMKRSQPKVLRLNLTNSPYVEAKEVHRKSPESDTCQNITGNRENVEIIKGPAVTPASSPDQGSPLTMTDAGTSSISSSDPGMSPFYSYGISASLNKDFKILNDVNRNLQDSNFDSECDNVSMCSESSYFEPWTVNKISVDTNISTCKENGPENFFSKDIRSSYEAFPTKLCKLNQQLGMRTPNHRIGVDLTKSVREAVSLARRAPPGPPPLCSICQHKAPAFGNPPKWFTFAELQHATQGFSQANFLAEGGFGSVHRGVLRGDLFIAVKQYKLASSQGDKEFCSEVEVLSCAQHRNVVMLIGFCVEEGRRLLVYEYICNGSLDSHLYGRRNHPLEWSARQKIAVGAARGLRYLHEECRVGCIVHRDMRPNNILLTHDFEPLVGDFGLARWQPDGDEGVETRVLGTFGYLAPEYAQSGQITEKADVYSFGVVLLELVTGRKAIDLSRPRGQQSLTEWARPLLEKHAIHELIDPHLRYSYKEQEILDMMQCSALCIRHDPNLRPRMSQVLRMVEGEI